MSICLKSIDVPLMMDQNWSSMSKTKHDNYSLKAIQHITHLLHILTTIEFLHQNQFDISQPLLLHPSMFGLLIALTKILF
jgi:hypothetical protein